MEEGSSEQQCNCDGRLGWTRGSSEHRWRRDLEPDKCWAALDKQEDKARRQQILSRLQAWDLNPAEIGETRARCYSVNPKTLLVGGGTLEVYEYEDHASEAVAIGQISPGYFDASIVATGLTDSTSSAHFYGGDRLLVIYTGTDARAIEALVSALGPEFADGASAISC